MTLAIILAAVVGVLLNVEFWLRRAASSGPNRFQTTWHFAFHWLATRHGTPLQQILGSAVSAEDALVLVTLT